MTDFESRQPVHPTKPDSHKTRAPYAAPRIVSYSAEDLDKHVPQVTACDSFNPNAFQPDGPSAPGGKF